jgi:hypothetical protein
MSQCMALKRLKGLRLKAVRQLYPSTVIPRMDYAASVWYRPDSAGNIIIRGMLDSVQRLGARSIISAFRTVSTSVLETEAGLLPTDTRLRIKLLKHVANLHTLPPPHPFWACQARAQQQGDGYTLPLATLLRTYAEELGVDEGQDLEKI